MKVCDRHTFVHFEVCRECFGRHTFVYCEFCIKFQTGVLSSVMTFVWRFVIGILPSFMKFVWRFVIGILPSVMKFIWMFVIDILPSILNCVRKLYTKYAYCDETVRAAWAVGNDSRALLERRQGRPTSQSRHYTALWYADCSVIKIGMDLQERKIVAKAWSLQQLPLWGLSHRTLLNP